MKAYVSEKRPTADAARPGTSRRCSADWSRVSAMKSGAVSRPAIPTGTLMKKIQCQLTCSTSRPPTRGPIASAIAETPAQMPIARPRSRGAKVAVMIDSVAGFISAPPRPCTMRGSRSPPPATHRSMLGHAAVPAIWLAPVREVVWAPAEATIEHANAPRLMRRAGAATYAELQRRSVEDPAWFWPLCIEDLGLEFARPWQQVFDDARGPEWTTWFV